MARPIKLSDSIQSRICDLLRGGNFRQTAALAAGVSGSTLRLWMAKGKKATKGAFRAFRLAVLAAEQEAETTMVERLFDKDAQPKDKIRAAQWWLEHKFPERWGRDRQTIRELKRQLDELAKRLPPEASPGTEESGHA